ncbi:MAG: hypothetical protein ACLFQV_10540 [Vulcanimicrobiota bacterium]
METYLRVLTNEFKAGDWSFLNGIRTNMEWDKAAFNRLATAMKLYCENNQDAETLQKWLAEGFWYIPRFTRFHTSQNNFPRQYPDSYYEKAYQLLDDLAYWFFKGIRPHEGGQMLVLPDGCAFSPEYLEENPEYQIVRSEEMEQLSFGDTGELKIPPVSGFIEENMGPDLPEDLSKATLENNLELPGS